MFYDSTAVTTLNTRIGWAAPVAPSSITVDSGNLQTDSGLYFSSFHRLAIVENMKQCMPNPDNTNTSFNAFLTSVKQQAVIKVLTRIFSSDRANFYTDTYGLRVDISTKDYSEIIINRTQIFDNAIGYQGACDAIELMMMSNRSNRDERNAKDSYNTFKIELEGITDQNGNRVSKGLFYKLEDAILTLMDILFPVYKVSPVLRNASFKW